MAGVLERILDAAARAPERYAPLIDGARRVGARLRHQGVGKGDLVGLTLPPSHDLIVGALAAWMIGAAFAAESTACTRVDLDAAAIAAGAQLAWSVSGVVARRPADELAYVWGDDRVTHGELARRVAAPSDWFARTCAGLIAGEVP